MDPLTASFILSAGTQAYRIGKGIQQKKKGKQIQVEDRKVSDRLKRVASDATTRAQGSKMAGQDRLEEIVQSQGANMLETARGAATPNQYLNAVTKASGATQDRLADIGVTAAQDKKERERYSDRLQQVVGGEETRIREANIADQARMKQGLLSSGEQNIYSGIEGLAGSAASFYGAKKGAGDGDTQLKKVGGGVGGAGGSAGSGLTVPPAPNNAVGGDTENDAMQVMNSVQSRADYDSLPPDKKALLSKYFPDYIDQLY